MRRSALLMHPVRKHTSCVSANSSEVSVEPRDQSISVVAERASAHASSGWSNTSTSALIPVSNSVASTPPPKAPAFVKSTGPLYAAAV
jgi:hypothetical protein